jgi:hypothetical protein
MWVTANSIRASLSYELKIQFHEQDFPDSWFGLRNFRHEHCRSGEPPWRPSHCGKSGELWMECGCPSPDRWQSRREHCTGPPLRRSCANRTPYVDRVGGAKLRLSPAHVDNVEGAAGANVCIYRGVGLGSRCSRQIWLLQRLLLTVPALRHGRPRRKCVAAVAERGKIKQPNRSHHDRTSHRDVATS